MVLDKLPTITPAEIAAHPQSLRPQNGLSDQEWDALKEQIGTQAAPAALSSVGSGGGPTQRKAEGALTPYISASFIGLSESGLTPSDMGLAVGSFHVIQAVNAQITVIDKVTGVTQAGFPKSLNAFFNLPPTAFTFDPRATYDAYNDRYIVIANRADFPNSIGFIEIAISATGNPLGIWYIYQLQTAGVGSCPDYPTIGQDHTPWLGEYTGGLYVSFNEFTCSRFGYGGFIDAKTFLLPKTPMYAGLGFSFWFIFGYNFGGLMVDTLQPANVVDPNDQPRAEFLVHSFNIRFGSGQCRSGCSGLGVWAISNPFGFLLGGPGPEISESTVPTMTYRLAPSARQFGTTARIDTGDVRLSGSVSYKAGSLWASLTTGFPFSVQASFAWWEIHPTLNDNNPRCALDFTDACPQITATALRNQKCYFCFGGIRGNGAAYYATVQPDPETNTTVTFAFSTEVDYASIAYLSDRVTQAVNTFHDGGWFLVSGQAPYTRGRWGDYSATALDGNTMWFSGMFTRADGLWGTGIGSNGYTDPTQP